MKYYLFRFKFLTPVHFGAAENKKNGNLQSFNCYADTFFSALAAEAASLDASLCAKIIAAAEGGSLLFSDLLPYYEAGAETELFVPVPVCRKEKLNTLNLDLSFKDLSLQYEAGRDYEELTFIRVSRIKNYLLPFGQKEYTGPVRRSFGWSGLQRRIDLRNGGEPYYVSNYRFADNAGLYCIAALRDESLLRDLTAAVEVLGMGGIGGRRSSGFGKFTLAGAPQLLTAECAGDAGLLHKALNDADSPLQMSLSVLCPQPQQVSAVKQGAFRLLKRSGFISTGGISEKRNCVYMLMAGSCFGARIEGQVLKFEQAAGHPVYRYGKALYMGLPQV